MRNALVVLGLVLVAAAGGAYVFFYGLDGFPVISSSAAITSSPSPTSVPFTPLARGQNSSIETRVNYLITSADQLQKLWEMVDATGTPPAVDFNKQSVLAVFAGQQPTTGYVISVSEIRDTSSRLVSITLAKPDSRCPTAQSLTAPYEIVAVPATTLSLTHKNISATIGCTD